MTARAPRLGRHLVPVIGVLVLVALAVLVAIRARADGSPTGSSPAPTVAPAAYPDPNLLLGDTNAHDPSMVKTPEGGYLLAVTGPNIPLKTSADLETFAGAGAAFPGGAPWTS